MVAHSMQGAEQVVRIQVTGPRSQCFSYYSTFHITCFRQQRQHADQHAFNRHYSLNKSPAPLHSSGRSSVHHQVIDHFTQMRTMLSSFLGQKQETTTHTAFCNYLASEVDEYRKAAKKASITFQDFQVSLETFNL